AGEALVSTNAQAVRRERYAEIGELIRRDAGTIIRLWAERAAAEQPQAQRVHHEVLLNHLPTFLDELGAHLAEAGEAADARPHRGVAKRHGAQRWETGWSLNEVVRDYRILRLVILDYLNETLDRPLRLLEVQAVGLALDEAIEASIDRFVRFREEEHRRLEEALGRQAAALREADRRKNEFLATLAHELRNPLSTLRSALEIMRRSGTTPIGQLAPWELIERQVTHMGRLVGDLLDVSRIAQGKLALKPEAVDLRGVLELAAQTTAPLTAARRQRFSLTLPDAPLGVRGDPARLLQVFVNLLHNAAKYTPDGGEVAVTAARDGDQTVVRIRDTGVGIPPEMLSRVFDLFTQIDIARDSAQGGLGIGLTLVRRLVELHGGTVGVASAGTGRGSEFTVRLPAGPPPTPACPAQPAGQRAAVARKILLVEDDDDGRDSLALLLQLVGHQVATAADGARALAEAATFLPEVALIDIGLPDMDGLELARQLRAVHGGAVRLVALTGYGQDEDQQRSFAAGFDHHLLKPVDLRTLESLLSLTAAARPPGITPAPPTS
ncbi:MAG: ATP-binding protein, partial [Gemmataceae bacterium]